MEHYGLDVGALAPFTVGEGPSIVSSQAGNAIGARSHQLLQLNKLSCVFRRAASWNLIQVLVRLSIVDNLASGSFDRPLIRFLYPLEEQEDTSLDTLELCNGLGGLQGHAVSCALQVALLRLSRDLAGSSSHRCRFFAPDTRFVRLIHAIVDRTVSLT